MLEDKLLIFQYNRGSREALRCIYDKYKNYLVTLAAALLFDVDAAEDVVHDVFVSFIESANKFRLTGSLKGYLATCVANKARTTIKVRIRHNTRINEDVKPAVTDPESCEFNAVFREDLQQLNDALQQLPYDQREVVILRIYSGLKFRTIARRQQCSVNTVQGRYRYALYKLRMLMNGEVLK